MKYWIARCQYCGKTGSTGPSSASGGAPLYSPQIPGKCPSHPSGTAMANHAPRWEPK